MSLLEHYDALLGRLRTELIAHYGSRLVSVAVFGSVGRGTPRHDSDVDVLVVARELPRGRTGRVEEFLPVESRLEPWLSPTDGSSGPIMLSPV
jgi:predicted nucleotidyltransferase